MSDKAEVSKSQEGGTSGKNETSSSDKKMDKGWKGEKKSDSWKGKKDDSTKRNEKDRDRYEDRRPEPRFPPRHKDGEVRNKGTSEPSKKPESLLKAKGDSKDMGSSPKKGYSNNRPERRRGDRFANRGDGEKDDGSKDNQAAPPENKDKSSTDLMSLLRGGKEADKEQKQDTVKSASDLEAQWQKEDEKKKEVKDERKKEEDKRKRMEDERRKEDEKRKRKEEERKKWDERKKRIEEEKRKEDERKKKREEEKRKKEEELKKKKEEEKKKKEEEKRKKEEEEKRKLEERKAREEEEKRLAEERKKEEEERKIREEEERKVREEEEARRLLEEEQTQLQDFISECQDRITSKTSAREANLGASENRPSDSFYGKLDSSLKKNTAFVKKLRNITDSQKDALTKDFESLNLSKYVGEAAASITEAKLKMSDVACAVHICSLLHQRYAEFAGMLLENWQKMLLSKKDEKISNPSKYRVDLRFFAELIAVGVFTSKEGLPLLANQLQILVSSDKEEHNNLSILLSFCKHCGDDYAGLLPRKFRLLAEKYGKEIARSKTLPEERQKGCRNLLKEYYNSLCKHLVKDHTELKTMEKQNRKILQTKGELSTERHEKYEIAVNSYSKLFQNTSAFADLLDEDMPDLPEDDPAEAEGVGLDVFNPIGEYQYEGDTALFEDEDTRVFYEKLPDLRALVPQILYKDSEHAVTQTTEDEGETDDTLEVEDIEKEMEEAAKSSDSSSVKEGESPGKEAEMTVEDIELHGESEDDETGDVGANKILLDTYLQTLTNCVNRELIDKAAIDFCTNLNTKTNRKKLVRALFTVHRTRYDLLPFYSRLVATLFPCMPDVATDLGQLLKGDFRWHVRKKDQINIESKMKTVRFIGELVKFLMFPKSEALHCLKMLLFDFSHHNIEMACALLDTCGRFLYRSADSHHRTKVYLDVMMRKKTALTLDVRYTTMIENAFYYSNPPEYQQAAKKERPPMHEYIRKLLYKDLTKTTTEKVLRQSRKLCWDDPELYSYATKCLIAVWNIRFNNVHCAANLLAGLAPYHEELAIHVVDGVLEDVRLGLEVNHPKYNQRRISSVKYLGELYNYRMVESSVIFKTLYTFITFGVTLDETNPTLSDPPEHLFRIRLCCTLLDTCGQYFDRGSSKKKLDCFLVYFQRYYWFKRSCKIWNPADIPFPMDVEYLYKDTVEALRPKLKLAENYEETCQIAEELDNEFRKKLAAILPIQEPDEGESETDDRGLHTIKETDEVDELSQGLSEMKVTGTTDEYGSTAESEDERGGQEHRAIGSQSQESESDGGSEEEADTDYLDSAGEVEDEDQVTVLTGGPKVVKCEEDDEFINAFDQAMSDQITARANEAVKVPTVDIAVPMHLKGQTRGKYGPGESTLDESTGTINFTLMTRKGNKPQYASLHVPMSAEFAAKFKEREQAEKAEKEKMKKMTLDIHERQEEEDYQEMLVNLNRAVGATAQNANRERRVRYQHPKGAPDADAIFGTKKR